MGIKTTTNETATENKYIPKKNFKQEVVDKALRSGFDCMLNNDSVVIFRSSEKNGKVTDWLKVNFGKEEDNLKTGKKEVRIPFSFGFGKIETQGLKVRGVEEVDG